MIFLAGLLGAGIGSAVGVSLKRRGNQQAQLIAAATAAIVFVLVTVIDGLLG